MANVKLDINIDDRRLRRAVAAFPNEMRQVMVFSLRESLKAIELIQVKRYLSDSLPSKPPGSTYVRTFRLRRSSTTRLIRTTLPRVSGEWQASVLYAKYVIGLRTQQARIHRGRWLSLEEITKRAQIKTNQIFEFRIDKTVRALEKRL